MQEYNQESINDNNQEFDKIKRSFIDASSNSHKVQYQNIYTVYWTIILNYKIGCDMIDKILMK